MAVLSLCSASEMCPCSSSSPCLCSCLLFFLFLGAVACKRCLFLFFASLPLGMCSEIGSEADTASFSSSLDSSTRLLAPARRVQRSTMRCRSFFTFAAASPFLTKSEKHRSSFDTPSCSSSAKGFLLAKKIHVCDQNNDRHEEHVWSDEREREREFDVRCGTNLLSNCRVCHAPSLAPITESLTLETVPRNEKGGNVHRAGCCFGRDGDVVGMGSRLPVRT